MLATAKRTSTGLECLMAVVPLLAVSVDSRSKLKAAALSIAIIVVGGAAFYCIALLLARFG